MQREGKRRLGSEKAVAIRDRQWGGDKGGQGRRHGRARTEAGKGSKGGTKARQERRQGREIQESQVKNHFATPTTDIPALFLERIIT